MFMRERSTQPEYFDTPGLSQAQRDREYRELDRLNGYFYFSHPFVSRLPRWLGKKRCERLEILDVGAGTGLLGKRLSGWAARRGWDWRFTNLDANPAPFVTDQKAAFLTGSALQLPFTDGSFDLVVASQMTHHFNEAEVVQHWREAWRVTREAVFICDLHRNAVFYAMLWLAMRLMRTEKMVLKDGLISVERGFRLDEWRALAAQAGISDAKVSLYYGTRIVLQARKDAR
jgi:SAM-dependent methyltransferase